MTRRETLLKEMQMLTGVVTNDFEYLVYLLIRKDKNTDKEVSKPIKLQRPKNVTKIESLDEWFNKLEVIDDK